MPDLLADAAPLYCPGCGFDLRATPGNRCGECGLEFDRAATADSANFATRAGSAGCLENCRTCLLRLNGVMDRIVPMVR